MVMAVVGFKIVVAIGVWHVNCGLQEAEIDIGVEFFRGKEKDKGGLFVYLERESGDGLRRESGGVGGGGGELLRRA